MHKQPSVVLQMPFQHLVVNCYKDRRLIQFLPLYYDIQNDILANSQSS